MAIQWFNKTIVCGTTAVAALFYYVIVLRNCKKNNEVDSKLKCIYLIKIRFINYYLRKIFAK